MQNFENDYYDGEEFITFNAINYNPQYKEISLAVTNRGKISFITYDLFVDKYGSLYFEYGNTANRIYLRNFTEIP